MPSEQPQTSLPTRPAVSVSLANRAALKQPDTFRLCPLGLQFFSRRPPELFTLLEVTIAIPGRRGRPKQIRCTGAVVHHQYDKYEKNYRVWLQFLDLPEEAKERLRCTGRSSGFICPHCRNY